jgi:hypothetical protein
MKRYPTIFLDLETDDVARLTEEDYVAETLEENSVLRRLSGRVYSEGRVAFVLPVGTSGLKFMIISEVEEDDDD